MPRDRPDEIKLRLVSRLTREEADEEPGRRSFTNMAALVAVLALVLLSYWVFQALDHSRRFQRCLDSGRRNCVDFVNPAK
jgi:hypothetical protein